MTRYYYKLDNSILSAKSPMPEWGEEITEEEFNQLSQSSEAEISDTDIEMGQLKGYLNTTDYIALKLAEADSNEREALKQVYKRELTIRQDCRRRINELEASSSI